MASLSDEYFKVYEEYSKVLRTWFVAYGIGAPVLILTNSTLSQAIKASGTSKGIGAAFLFGVILQVLLAVTNKVAMWGKYYGEIEPDFQGTGSYKFSNWICEKFWIDVLIDIITMASFIWATWRLFTLFA